MLASAVASAQQIALHGLQMRAHRLRRGRTCRDRRSPPRWRRARRSCDGRGWAGPAGRAAVPRWRRGARHSPCRAGRPAGCSASPRRQGSAGACPSSRIAAKTPAERIFCVAARISSICASVAFSAAVRAISGSISNRVRMISPGLVRRAIAAMSPTVSAGRLPTKVPRPTCRQSCPSACSEARALRNSAREICRLLGQFAFRGQLVSMGETAFGQKGPQAGQGLAVSRWRVSLDHCATKFHIG